MTETKMTDTERTQYLLAQTNFPLLDEDQAFKALAALTREERLKLTWPCGALFGVPRTGRILDPDKDPGGWRPQQSIFDYDDEALQLRVYHRSRCYVDNGESLIAPLKVFLAAELFDHTGLVDATAPMEPGCNDTVYVQTLAQQRRMHRGEAPRMTPGRVRVLPEKCAAAIETITAEEYERRKASSVEILDGVSRQQLQDDHDDKMHTIEDARYRLRKVLEALGGTLPSEGSRFSMLVDAFEELSP